MKNKIFLIMTIISSLFWACEDYLDKSPELEVTPEDIFGEYNSFREFSDYLYNLRNDYRWWFMRTTPGGMSDETQSNMPWTFTVQVNNGGNWLGSVYRTNHETGWELPGGKVYGEEAPVIANALKGLRHANICLSNLGLLVDATPEQKSSIKGEAHYFRAWYYFQVIKRWGGMPIFDKVLTPNDDMDYIRLSYQESTDWLIEEFDRAIEILPEVWEAHETGRITKGMALAAKEMALLYAASPLMNPENGFEYNTERCEATTQAALEVLKLEEKGIYRLYDEDEYPSIFYSKDQIVSKEAITYIHQSPRSAGDLKAGVMVKSFGGQNATDSPTQNIVDLFDMDNGLPIDDLNSGYDAQNPYVGRDPRFYNNIFYNGSLVGMNGNNPVNYQSYVGGREDKLKVNQKPWCGYSIKKLLPPGVNKWEADWNGWYMPWIDIRLAQIYLDFAEAANEAYGPNGAVPNTDLTAVKAINVIRNRVGMPDVDVKFTGSKEDFRERIRNERGVELMFEGHRWHDLRRWRIATEKLRHIYKVKITKSGNQYSYEYPELPGVRTFDEKNYWYPLPKNDVDMFNNLKQNPGW